MLPERCAADVDCVPCTGRVCVRGACFVERPSVDCATASCGECQLCLPRVGCVFAGGAICAADSECPRGMRCDGAPSGRCLVRSVPERCASHEDCVTCGQALSCARGRCVPTPTLQTCPPEGCPGCEVCEPGVGCIRPFRLPCATEAECGPAARCVNNVCQPREVRSCATNSDCIPCTARVCDLGQCRFSSEVVPRTDASSPMDAASPRRPVMDGGFDAGADGGLERRGLSCSVQRPARGGAPWFAAFATVAALAWSRLRARGPRRSSR